MLKRIDVHIELQNFRHTACISGESRLLSGVGTTLCWFGLLAIAIWSTVSPSSSVLPISALWWTSNSTSDQCPCEVARCNGVCRRLLRRSTFARPPFCERRIAATSLCPFKAARCNAANPSSFFTSTKWRARATSLSVALWIYQDKLNTKLARTYLWKIY